MRFVALISLAVAAAAGLWYTSNSSLPYYYDAGIFVLAITGAVLFVDISPNSRARRPRRIVRDGDRRKSPIIYDSHQIVCQVGPWKWDIEEFCTHWLITGDTGAGKTSSGLNRLLISLTERYPRWGALILDPKGVYWRTCADHDDRGRPARRACRLADQISGRTPPELSPSKVQSYR